MLPVWTVASHLTSASGSSSGGKAATHWVCMAVRLAAAWARVKTR